MSTTQKLTPAQQRSLISHGKEYGADMASCTTAAQVRARFEEAGALDFYCYVPGEYADHATMRDFFAVFAGEDALLAFPRPEFDHLAQFTGV
jgi:hypothetical protein